MFVYIQLYRNNEVFWNVHLIKMEKVANSIKDSLQVLHLIRC